MIKKTSEKNNYTRDCLGKIQLIENKAEKKKLSTLIINETRKTADLINELLDLSKIEAGKDTILKKAVYFFKMMKDIKETF